MPKKQLCELQLHIHHETDAALLVSTDGDYDGAVWVPKSRCQYYEDSLIVGTVVEVTMPEAFATEKGLT